MSFPGRIRVLDSNVSLCGLDAALDCLQAASSARAGGYVCFTNTHAVVLGRRDPEFRAITNDSLLSLADGYPVYLLGRLKRGNQIGHVPGPDFLIHALLRFAASRHFFYGSTPGVLGRLIPSLKQRIPGLQVCGWLSPPFRPLTKQEVRGHVRQIADSGADFVWVGLGAPKQERWMAETWRDLRPSVLLGVGAAFDFHAGTVRRAPEWITHSGLEWSYRLAQEPKRLWKRYLITNSLFVCYLVGDSIRLPRRALPSRLDNQ